MDILEELSAKSLSRRGYDIRNGLLYAPTSLGPYPVASANIFDGNSRTLRPRGAELVATERYETAWRSYINASFAAPPDADDGYVFRRLSRFETNALSEGVSEDGGLLVPLGFSAEIQARIAAVSVVRRFATVIPTLYSTLALPKFTPHPTDSAFASSWAAVWSGESDEPAQSDPAFEMVQLAVKKLRTPILRISNDLIEDQPAILNWLADIGSRDLASREDDGFLTGSGTGLEPRGLLNSGLPTAAAGAPTVAGLRAVVEALPATHRERARWVMNTTVEADVRALNDAGSNPAYPRDRNRGTVEGAPVSLSPHMPDGSVFYGDLSRYIIGQRSMSLQILKRQYIADDQTGMVITERVGGFFVDGAAGVVGTVA